MPSTWPSLSREEYTEIAPYIDMAESLGSLLVQISAGAAKTQPVESIEIVYNGRLAGMRTELLRNAALCGVLSPSEQVNRINAASIAAERGIRVHEEKKEAVTGGAANVLKLTLHSASGDLTASATVLHGMSSRLLSMDDIDIEAPLHGTLLFLRNQDVPGVIGRIGTILGEHKINIANFTLGRPDASRAKAKGEAMAVIQIDAEDNQANIAQAITALKSVDAVLRVGLVKLK